MDEEKVISVSSKQLAAILILVATVAGGPGVLNLVDSGSRADPFTGTEGRELRAEIKELRDEMYKHRHEAPPRWVLERLKHIEEEIHQIKDRCKILENDV